MSELVFSLGTFIKIKIGEQSYSVKKPNNRQIKEFQKIFKEKSEDDALDILINLLSSLGLPEDICWELDAESLQVIIEALLPKKKG
jgi:hypothetical protein